MAGFIRESWYAAVWSADLGDAPLARTFLGEDVVLYRGEGGRAVALEDTCPHRFAPLHAGRVSGDEIACPYHGLRFAADGRCVHNPHGPVPGVARVRSYPLAERNGMVWIWTGNGAPDPDAVPDMAALDDPAFAWVRGALHVKGHYQLVVDNLLDLTHVEFMHPFLAAPGNRVPVRYQARQDGEIVHALYDKDGASSAGLVRMLWADCPDTVRMWSYMRWEAPAAMYLDNGFAREGEGDGGPLLVPNYHLVTPESATTSHYFWAAGRNMALADAELSANMARGMEHTFGVEDEPMIAMIQAKLGERDLLSMKPLLLSIDNAAVRARRIIERHIAAEQAGGIPAAAGSTPATTPPAPPRLAEVEV